MITSVGQMTGSNGDVNMEEQQGGFTIVKNTRKKTKKKPAPASDRKTFQNEVF